MTDTQSEPQDPASPDEPPSVDTEALRPLLKSLSAVFKEHRTVLPRLPELMEQCLNTKPRNPDLVESRPEEESRGDDAVRLAERKRRDLERNLGSMEFDINVKTKRIAALDQTIKDKTATLEAMKSEENAITSARDRKTVEKASKKRDKLLEESEKEAKCREEECLNLKKELQKKEREISEREKVQAEKCVNLEKELEKKEKEISETKKVQEERYDAAMNELAAKDKEIQEYHQSLSKMKEVVRNAHANVDLYKSRLASVSEKRVKQDQRLVEDTLSLNRQSDVERDFSTFFDDDRMDALGIIQSMYQNKEDSFVYIYYPRLACIIFETAYEQVKEAKEAATDLFKELIKIMINYTPFMGKDYSKARKEQLQVWTVPLNIATQSDGSECSNDVLDGMMLSLKEAALNCNLDYLVEGVSTTAYEKWGKWYDEDKSCFFTPASHLMKDLDKYTKACIRLTWRMVTQVPPMKLEFRSSRFSKDVHKHMGYYGSVERRTRNSQPAHHFQREEIACYLWPGLQDGGGRLIRAGEVVCKVEEP